MSDPGEGARSRSAWRSWRLWALVACGVAVKSWIVLQHLPSMWLWLDELHYFTTAFDLTHWGDPGVPHPGFLFYPPLTSVVIAPLHLIGLAPPAIYHASLILLNGILTFSMVFGGYSIYRELFSDQSLPLAAFLLFAPPAHCALMLMSEPLFVALLTWMMYFFVRAFKHGRLRDFAFAGLCAALLPLTREIGVVVIPSLLVLAPLQVRLLREWESTSAALGKVSLLCALPIVAVLGWRLVEPAAPGSTAAGPEGLGVLDRAWSALGQSPELSLILARNFLTSFGYISFTTLGVCLPIVVWAALRSRRERLVWLVVAQTLALMAFVAAGVALFMFGARSNPLPRWIMYGRYVEYFAPILFALALGLFRELRKGSLRGSASFVVFLALLNLGLTLVIPDRFYALSMRNQIAPNSLGLALPLETIGGSGLQYRYLLLALAVLVGAVAAFKRLHGQRWIRWPAAAGLFLFVVFNYRVALAEVARNSGGAHHHGGIYSRFLAAHPMMAADRVYVDWRHWGDLRGRNDLAFKAVADHIGSVLAGTEPEVHAGKLPVLTKVELPEQRLLFKHPRLDYRFYGAAPARPPVRSGLALVVPEEGALFLAAHPEAGFRRLDAGLGASPTTGTWLAGDWNGDGLATLGHFSNGRFCLSHALERLRCDRAFELGSAGDLPVVGDWNGDGIDSVGVFSAGRFLLKNRNLPGGPDLVVPFGLPGDIPLAGDWNGNGLDTLAVLRGHRLYLSNRQTGGVAEREIDFGAPPGQPIVGDWDGDGSDWIGFFREGSFALHRDGAEEGPFMTLEAGSRDGAALAGVWRDGAP